MRSFTAIGLGLLVACGGGPPSPDGAMADAAADTAAPDTGADGSSDASAVDAGPPPGPDAGPPPGPDPWGIDAAVWWSETRAYLFRGDAYIRYDLGAASADEGYPRDIGGLWPGLWPADIDAAFLEDADVAYFLRGGEVVRYDIVADRAMDGYPRAIADELPGAWVESVDAAFSTTGGEVFFFRGPELLRYDLATRAVAPGYPRAIREEWPGAWADRVDAALYLGGGRAALFRDRERVLIDLGTGEAAAPPAPFACEMPGLWDPNEGTGVPGDRLPADVAAMLIESPSAEEVAARKARARLSVGADTTDLSSAYPLFLASVERRLGAWGCLLLRTSSGAHRFRCATDTGGPRPLAVAPLLIESIDWRNATYHRSQVSQGDFSADPGTPLSVLAADDDEFFIERVSSNGSTGSISAGLNVRVRYRVDGVDKHVGFSHLNGAVPDYVLAAAESGAALPVGTVFGFIGYTGNLWIAAPPATDAPYEGTGAGLPVAHSHLWFVSDLDNHEALTPATRRALDYCGVYPFGGG